MINFCSILLKMALIFKFQTIPSLIFYSGDDKAPPTPHPSTRPVCPCDRHRRNNIRILTPADKLCGLIIK